jgi:hypothetical protein
MRATLSPPDVTAASGGSEDAPFVPTNRREGYTRQGSRSVEVDRFQGFYWCSIRQVCALRVVERRRKDWQPNLRWQHARVGRLPLVACSRRDALYGCTCTRLITVNS